MQLDQLGKLIKEQRDTQGISQAQLAKAAHFQQYEISKLEAGQLPNVGYNRIISILTALNIEVDIILPKQ